MKDDVALLLDLLEKRECAGVRSWRRSSQRIAATGVLGLVAARAQHQTVEQRRIPAMANVMQFELLPRPAGLIAVLGAQQGVAANDRTEFSAQAC